MVHVAVLILLAVSCVIVVGALSVGIFICITVLYYAWTVTGNGTTRTSIHESILLVPPLIVLLLLFVGNALYDWADAQVMLSETPTKVVVFIVYVVVAIEATLCMVPVVIARMNQLEPAVRRR